MVRTDAQWWLGASDRDEAMARSLLNDSFYEGVAFHSQQAAEKALKAMLVSLGKQAHTHSCVELLKLAEELGVQASAAVLMAARRLDLHYTASRYPNGAGGPPESMYDEELARECIAWMTTIGEFCRSQMR